MIGPTKILTNTSNYQLSFYKFADIEPMRSIKNSNCRPMKKLRPNRLKKSRRGCWGSLKKRLPNSIFPKYPSRLISPLLVHLSNLAISRFSMVFFTKNA